MLVENSKIFIVHYAKMEDRKRYLSDFFRKNDIEVTWLLNGQREDLTEEIVSEFYKLIPEKYGRQLSLGEIGCAIGHYQGIKEVVDNNLDYAIFFEDDVVFNQSFKQDFNNKFKTFEEEFDLISLGDCCNIGVYGQPIGNGFYRIIPSRGRCGYAHILSNKACNILMNSLPFQYPIDWHIGHDVNNREYKFKTYWVDPPLAFEGSKEGNYGSTIR